MTPGERVVVPDDYDSDDKRKTETQQRRILGISSEIMKTTDAPEFSPTSQNEQLGHTTEQIPTTAMELKKNPVPNQVIIPSLFFKNNDKKILGRCLTY